MPHPIRAADVVEATPTAILIVDSEGLIEQVNSAAERVFGYPRGSLISKKVEILVPDRFRHAHALLRTTFFSRPETRPMGAGRDLFGLRADGTEFPIEIGLSPIASDRGTMTLASIVDISVRKSLQDQLRETSELLSATLDAAPFPILVTSPDGRVLVFNRAGERIFGYAATEIIGGPFTTLVPHHLREEADRMFALSASESRAQGVRVEVAHRDGHSLSVNLFNAPIFYADGRVRAVVSSLEDVTQREAMEGQLRQAQKMEAVGHLTGGIAHDFNNLLGIILGNLDLIRSSSSANDDLVGLAGEAIEAAQRGAELTRRMLAFARKQPLQPQLLDLNDLVRSTARLLGRVLRENIDIELRLADSVWPVLADATQLEAALTNLATNARDAMPRGGRITIATANSGLDQDYALEHPGVVSGDYVLIEFSDTGTGIAPDLLPRIFEPFFSTKEREQGTGLGLSMVFGFVKQSGGHINVYSEVGMGSTFRIYLPRVLYETREAPVQLSEALVGQQPPIATVLAVEDNAALLRIVVRQLEELGYRVVRATNASEAIRLLEGGGIDVLFTDVIMPGDLDGIELAEMALARWPSVKVVLTSGFPNPRWKEDAPLHGLRLLAKPYLKDDLASALREALGQ